MYQFKDIGDTIAAVATSAGQGGIGIVRLSGPDALKICDAMFVTRSGRKPSTVKSFTVHYGWVVRPQAGAAVDQPRQVPEEGMIDEALLTVMRAPRTYTRQDVVEISCHGGPVPLKAVLGTMIELGARMAEPGEFTKRAFLSGRIDLTQAEAVLDIIQAKTDAFLKVSSGQLKGNLAAELELIRQSLLAVYVELEAVINFPEDDLDADGRDRIMERVQAAVGRVEGLLRSADKGRILKEGVRVVLCGQPNVGKSSLLNAILNEPRAIVTDIPGTTRDTLEESAQIKGIPFQLVDTAGILEPRDLIEEEAVRRSRQMIATADLVILVIDGSRSLNTEDERLMEFVRGQNLLIAVNKSDLPEQVSDESVRAFAGPAAVCRLSVRTRCGLAGLEESIVERVWKGKEVDAAGILVSNVRHVEALQRCLEALQGAQRGMQEGVSLEFVSEDIKSAVNRLDGITGRDIDADLLDTIFSSFCIGK